MPYVLHACVAALLCVLRKRSLKHVPPLRSPVVRSRPSMLSRRSTPSRLSTSCWRVKRKVMRCCLFLQPWELVPQVTRVGATERVPCAAHACRWVVGVTAVRFRVSLQGTRRLWTPTCQQLQLGEQGCIYVAISNAEFSACWASRGACSNRISSASATVEPAVSSALGLIRLLSSLLWAGTSATKDMRSALHLGKGKGSACKPSLAH